jgi:hypothetical protein
VTAWNQGVQVLVVDSDGEYQPIADAVGGTTLHLGAPGVHLNSLDLGIEPDALTRRALFCHTLSRRRVWCWTGRDRRLHHQGHHQRPRTNTRPASLLSDLTHALDQDPDPAGAALAAASPPLSPAASGRRCAIPRLSRLQATSG